jgi:hypothetical protein
MSFPFPTSKGRLTLNIKEHVETPSAVISEAIQLYLFKYGFSWGHNGKTIQYIYKPYLCISPEDPTCICFSNDGPKDTKSSLGYSDFLELVKNGFPDKKIAGYMPEYAENGESVKFGCKTVKYEDIQHVLDEMKRRRL